MKLTFSWSIVSGRGLKKLHRVAARDERDERDGGEHLSQYFLSYLIEISARHGGMKVNI